MNTTDILQKTEKLVNGDRDKTHGNKIENHENISRLWSAYLQNKTKLNIILSPEDVAQLMSLLKIARTQAGEHNIDDYVDAVGYQAIAGEIAKVTKPLSSIFKILAPKVKPLMPYEKEGTEESSEAVQLIGT